MKTVISIMLVIVLLLGGNALALTTTQETETPVSDEFSEFLNDNPQLFIQEIEFRDISILQIFEIATWKTTTRKISSTFQLMLDNAEQYDLQKYDRIYFSEIAQNGDILGSYIYDLKNDSWQKSIFEESAKEITAEDYTQYKVADYQSFARRPSEYEGDLIQVTGTVLQVMEGSDFTAMRVAQNDDYDHVWYIEAEIPAGSDRILEGDTVTFYGSYYGLHSYETVMGATVTIPCLIGESYVIK